MLNGGQASRCWALTGNGATPRFFPAVRMTWPVYDQRCRPPTTIVAL